ncbi:MAG: DNA-processing protein DprA [Helicobacteraceae bacterium]|nr:DNA-processing protein DprA [Helicobacteraceae bacterium]
MQNLFKKQNAPFPLLESLPESLKNFENLRLYYAGNLELLNKRKITILGSRNPNPYAQSFTATLAQKLSKSGAVIVSGGALGIDIIAHTNSMPQTIMISPSSLDIIYPQSNKKIISKIYKEALILSPFTPPYMPHRFSFLERNKIIVRLGECVIIPQADLQSGSMQSANYALKNKIPLFVPPHQLGHSLGTQKLAKEGKAGVIWDIDEFVESLNLSPQFKQDSTKGDGSGDEVLRFCAKNPFFEEAFLRFGDIIYEYELEGKIRRINGRLEVVY